MPRGARLLCYITRKTPSPWTKMGFRVRRFDLLTAGLGPEEESSPVTRVWTRQSSITPSVERENAYYYITKPLLFPPGFTLRWAPYRPLPWSMRTFWPVDVPKIHSSSIVIRRANTKRRSCNLLGLPSLNRNRLLEWRQLDSTDRSILLNNKTVLRSPTWVGSDSYYHIFVCCVQVSYSVTAYFRKWIDRGAPGGSKTVGR